MAKLDFAWGLDELKRNVHSFGCKFGRLIQEESEAQSTG